jgi:predicted methyltransferase/DNA-directed RNA polymerase subunit RPC12/RpoP
MTESHRIVHEVAASVGLAEGDAGVRDVVRAAARLEPVAVRKISRATELPVPIVSAICNELRKHGVVDRARPVQLTAHGRELFATPGSDLAAEAACPACAQREIVVPKSLAPVARRLAAFADRAPTPRVELDQVHCDVETKIRRVLALHEVGALDGRRILLLGDDDLTSLAIFLVAERLGVRPDRVVVVEVDPALVAFLRRTPFDVHVLAHDLRDPLPAELCGSVDTVFTDPPYTVEGATLFLSRAAEAVAGRSRADVFLAFGGKRPEESLRVQRAIAEMGFVVRRLVRNFNEYRGAGALGGVSHLYQLASTSELTPLLGARYDGRLYTGDLRPPVRRYRCRSCRRIDAVGHRQPWPTIEALRRDGCPRCGSRTFLPLARSE